MEVSSWTHTSEYRERRGFRCHLILDVSVTLYNTLILCWRLRSEVNENARNAKMEFFCDDANALAQISKHMHACVISSFDDFTRKHRVETFSMFIEWTCRYITTYVTAPIGIAFYNNLPLTWPSAWHFYMHNSADQWNLQPNLVSDFDDFLEFASFGQRKRSGLVYLEAMKEELSFMDREYFHTKTHFHERTADRLYLLVKRAELLYSTRK